MVGRLSPNLYATVDNKPSSEYTIFGPTLNKVNAPLPETTALGAAIVGKMQGSRWRGKGEGYNATIFRLPQSLINVN